MTKADPAAVLESPGPPARPAAPIKIGAPPRPRPRPRPRHVGAINWLGVWTLYVKEVHRFIKVFTQTVLAPTLTTLLFLAIFSLALGGAARSVGDLPFIEFLAPGLVMMAIVLQAVGLPLEAQGVIIAVDRVLDMCRTSVNVWSDSCGCAVMDRFEKAEPQDE